MVVKLGHHYHVGEKPTVIQYTYINRHAGTPDKTKTIYTMSLDYNLLHCVYDRMGVDEGNLQVMDVEINDNGLFFLYTHTIRTYT